MPPRNEQTPPPLSPNRIVAWNLHRARRLRGWTQDEAAERLEPFVGKRWSKASWSAAEQSVVSNRVRQFTADDLYAFARCFELPLSFFLVPPPSEVFEQPVGVPGADRASARLEYLDLIFDWPEDARRNLLKDVIEASPETTLALRRWGENFAKLVAEREQFIKDLRAISEPETSQDAG